MALFHTCGNGRPKPWLLLLLLFYVLWKKQLLCGRNKKFPMKICREEKKIRKYHLMLVLSVNTVESFLFLDYFFVKWVSMMLWRSRIATKVYKQNLRVIDAWYLCVFFL